MQVEDGFSKNARAFLIDSLLSDDQKEPPSPLNLSICNQPDIKCDLTRPQLWQQFAEIGTEMIITKAGRRMFPTVQVQFSGESINPSSNYLVVFEIVPASGKRFRYSYVQSSWTALEVAGNGAGSSRNGRSGNYFAKQSSASDFHREMGGSKFYVYPECPLSGQRLVDCVLSFEKVKLTNSESLSQFNDHMVLKSMHQYEPRVHLIELASSCDHPGSSTALPLEMTGGNFSSQANTVWTFNFPEARFMAVTAYQNQLITKLKIDNNPFAKGFRKLSRFSVAQVHLAIGNVLTSASTSNVSPPMEVSPRNDVKSVNQPHRRKNKRAPRKLKKV